MADGTGDSRLVKLRRFKDHLRYIEKELNDNGLGLAGHFVGAAECAVDQEITAAWERQRAMADDAGEPERDDPNAGVRRRGNLMN